MFDENKYLSQLLEVGKAIYYPSEVRREENWGLAVFLFQYTLHVMI